MSEDTTSSSAPIVCPLFPWYSRLNHRFSGLGAMLLIFGAWFYIDGTVRWPKENLQVTEREAFIKQVEAAKAAGSLDSWLAQAKTTGLNPSASLDKNASNLGDILWATQAAQKGWPEKPKRHTEEELTQQVQLAKFMFVALAVLLIYVFMVRNRQLVGNADHLITPDGKRIDFSAAFKIDKRKWDKQGLAYVFYRDGTAERKAAIDDLQYDGAGKVLERLLANFHGELIETLPETDEETPADEGSEGAAP